MLFRTEVHHTFSPKTAVTPCSLRVFSGDNRLGCFHLSFQVDLREGRRCSPRSFLSSTLLRLPSPSPQASSRVTPLLSAEVSHLTSLARRYGHNITHTRGSRAARRSASGRFVRMTFRAHTPELMHLARPPFVSQAVLRLCLAAAHSQCGYSFRST
jgi:hypothetical protein